VQGSPLTDLDQIEGQYDYVVMNPPFNIKWATYEAQSVSVSGATKSEHLFLELAVRALKPGGQAAVIAPHNLFDKLPRAAQSWFEKRLSLEAQFGPLPGEFELTKIKVHGFIFTRLAETPPPVTAVPELPASDGLRLVLEREAFYRALTHLAAVAQRQAVVDIFTHVLLEAEADGRLRLRAANPNTGMTTWLQPATLFD